MYTQNAEEIMKDAETKEVAFLGNNFFLFISIFIKNE